MARKDLNILVAGGFPPKEDLGVPEKQIIQFGQCLGVEIMKQGHNLWTGCQTEFDKTVGEAAHSCAPKNKKAGADPQSRIISYLFKNQDPIHNYGVILQSNLSNWDIGGLEPNPPELIQYADVVILVGGFYGTFQAANWARLNRKALLPFASFGGSAREVHKVESARFDEAYAANIRRLEYEKVLKAIAPTDMDGCETLARQTINLAEKMVTTSSVFVIMSFAEKGKYKDLYAAIQRVCTKFDYEAQRVDESNLLKRIIPEILRQVRQSAFVIADVTEQKPNVLYELGFADGVGKKVILLAKKGTKLSFDIHDVPVLFWGDSLVDLEKELVEKVKEIGSWQGRTQE